MGSHVTWAFSFVGRFVGVRNFYLKSIASKPRYHKWPNYEVLELVKDEDGYLAGFRVHFSNGSAARFFRGPNEVDCDNMVFLGEHGELTLMNGLQDKLEPRWKIDGREVDFGTADALENPPNC